MSMVPKLRFPEFDDEWEARRLQNLGALKSGNGFPESEQGGAVGVPFFKVSDMNLPGNEDSMNQANNYVSDEQCRRLRLTPFHEPSIIFAKVGAAIALERKRRAQNFLIDNNMMAFTPDAAIDFDFCVQSLRRISFSKYVQVGALPSYNASDIGIIEVALPSLPEQQKIASFLSAVDKKIDLLRQKKEKLEAYKKGLMQAIFSQEIRFKADDGSDFPGWEEVTVGDMAQRHVRGLTSSTLEFVANGYPVYGASGVIGYIEDYLSDQRYIGVVKDGAGVGRVFEAVAKSSLLSTMESIIPKAGFSFGFVKQVIKDIDFKRFITGSTIPHVYFRDYSKEAYPCPSFEEQEKIAHLLDLFDAKLERLSSQLNCIETFKKGLLQQMFV